MYRPVNVGDIDADETGGTSFGLASETDLRCGFCAVSVPREAREFFYRRWYAVIEASGR